MARGFNASGSSGGPWLSFFLPKEGPFHRPTHSDKVVRELRLFVFVRICP